jgi:hypothetical protein
MARHLRSLDIRNLFKKVAIVGLLRSDRILDMFNRDNMLKIACFCAKKGTLLL